MKVSRTKVNGDFSKLKNLCSARQFPNVLLLIQVVFESGLKTKYVKNMDNILELAVLLTKWALPA